MAEGVPQLRGHRGLEHEPGWAGSPESWARSESGSVPGTRNPEKEPGPRSQAPGGKTGHWQHQEFGCEATWCPDVRGGPQPWARLPAFQKEHYLGPRLQQAVRWEGGKTAASEQPGRAGSDPFCRGWSTNDNPKLTWLLLRALTPISSFIYRLWATLDKGILL